MSSDTPTITELQAQRRALRVRYQGIRREIKAISYRRGWRIREEHLSPEAREKLRLLELAASENSDQRYQLVCQIHELQQLRQRALSARQLRTAGAKPLVLEFVYRHEWYIPDYSCDPSRWSTNKHVILRKTKKRIFFAVAPWNDESDSIGRDTTPGVHSVARAALERGETVRTGRRWGKGWTLNPEPPPHWSDKPAGTFAECATAADVKRVFRREVKRAHPDHGGTSEQFHALRAEYVQALARQQPESETARA